MSLDSGSIYRFYFVDLTADKDNIKYSDPMETDKFYACDTCQHYQYIDEIPDMWNDVKDKEINTSRQPGKPIGLPGKPNPIGIVEAIKEDKKCIRNILPCPRVFCIHYLPESPYNRINNL